jgi:hypothetical protein
MKTTLNVPDELYRQVKIRAAQDGVPVTELVVQGLQLILRSNAPSAQFPLVESKHKDGPLTVERVREIRARMDHEEDLKHAFPRGR